MTGIAVLYLGVLLGIFIGYWLARVGYWLGRMHEYDYCKSQGWFNPVIRATTANIHIDATDEQVADALIRESRKSNWGKP